MFTGNETFYLSHFTFFVLRYYWTNAEYSVPIPISIRLLYFDFVYYILYTLPIFVVMHQCKRHIILDLGFLL